ncbi:MAG TPA: GtrA family protein [Chitinophagaceae bacterium]|nr:GtrA family protein [Chitinophagaceae bacterium]
MKNLISNTIDFFYPPFRRYIPHLTFRYLACGGFTTLVDISLFFISYHFILHEKMVHLMGFTISPYIAAFLMAFCISFPTGFILSKFIVFTGSVLRGRVQLIRYFMLVGVCILLNYIFLKFFVEWVHLYATVAKIFTTLLVACFSYLTQKHFTFEVNASPAEKPVTPP